MGLFSSFADAVKGLATGLGILGSVSAAERRRKLDKRLVGVLDTPAPPLEIPSAYQQLLGSVDQKISQLGEFESGEIDRGYSEALARSLGQLNRRGLGSSSLTANFTRTNERDRLRSRLGLQEMLLGQRIGAQQNLGLSGLGQAANERQQLAALQGNILTGVSNPVLLHDPMQMYIQAAGKAAGAAYGLG